MGTVLVLLVLATIWIIVVKAEEWPMSLPYHILRFFIYIIGLFIAGALSYYSSLLLR